MVDEDLDLAALLDDKSEYRVLVITSRGEHFRGLERLLLKSSCRVFIAKEIAKGAALCRSFLFDAVVIDAEQHWLLLADLFTSIREEKSLRLAPLFVVHPEAGSVDTADVLPGVQVEFLKVPLETSLLFVKLTSLFRRQQLSREQAVFESTIAVQNAELCDLTARLRKEVNEAKYIHECLLPQILPEDDLVVFAAAYRPLDEVGGNFYDIWALRDGLYSLFVADVAGVGLAAAFIGAMTKMALRALVKESPVETLAAINTRMLKVLPAGRGASACAATYDAHERRLRIACAGAPLPLLYRAAADAVQTIGQSGSALGRIEHPRYELSEMKVEPGDKLLLFTEGLPQTIDMNGLSLGRDGIESRFAKFARESGIGKCEQSLISAQEEFTGGRLLRLDTTVVGLEVCDSVPNE